MTHDRYPERSERFFASEVDPSRSPRFRYGEAGRRLAEAEGCYRNHRRANRCATCPLCGVAPEGAHFDYELIGQHQYCVLRHSETLWARRVLSMMNVLMNPTPNKRHPERSERFLRAKSKDEIGIISGNR